MCDLCAAHVRGRGIVDGVQDQGSEAGYRRRSFEGAVEELCFAYANVPFYKAHLEAAGIRPASISAPDDFRNVPPTAKMHYRRNFPLGVLARGKTLREPLTLKSQSSGTGGERLTTITHTYDLANRMRVTLTANTAFSRALASCKRQRPARYAAPNCSDVECATPFTTMHDRILADGTLVLPVAHDLLATPDELIRQAIAEVKEFEPHWFYADATHLAFLVRQFRRHGEAVPPVSAIALTYTLVTAVARRQIRNYFGHDTPMTEIVSMTELGWVAVECGAGRMHVNNSSFFAEFLVDSRPAVPGELAELIVTSIGDRLLPHMRYRTGDIYRLGLEPCECGSDLPLATHEGRRQNMVALVKDGQQVWVSPREVDGSIGAEPTIDVYHLHQAKDGSLRFQYIPSSWPTRVNEWLLEERLRELLGSEPKLAIDAVRYIPCQQSGKFASCTSEISGHVSAAR
jgi:phenylacetate-CoA ligase